MTTQVWRERAEAAEAECDRLRESLVAATDAAEALLAQVEATALRVAARETRDAASLRSLMATDAAARAYLAAERARCATVCREVALFYDASDIGSVVALACADSIEREPLDIQRIAK